MIYNPKLNASKVNDNHSDTVGRIIESKFNIIFEIYDSFEIIIAKMRSSRKYAAVVNDFKGSPAGLITAQKILNNTFGDDREYAFRSPRAYRSYRDLIAKDIMIHNPHCLDYNDSVNKALNFMALNDMRYMPVVKDEKTVGLADIRDLMRHRYTALEDVVENQGQILSYIMGSEDYGCMGGKIAV